jgi:hypothetical protein
MLTDNGELLFETNEMDFNAIGLEPARIGDATLIIEPPLLDFERQG